MNETPLHSSALAGFRYDPDLQQLWLRFRSGDLYVFQVVPAAVIQALIDAPSQGLYFNTAIRGRFPCRRLS
jgi:lysyl-tRNA synthetase class 2